MINLIEPLIIRHCKLWLYDISSLSWYTLWRVWMILVLLCLLSNKQLKRLELTLPGERITKKRYFSG